MATAATKRTPAKCQRADCRDDYVLPLLDPALIARQLQTPGGSYHYLWDANVLPTVQPYIEHTRIDLLDPGYLYRAGEFFEALAKISEAHIRPIILPSIAQEASGMMGGLHRRAKAKARDASADIAQTLLWISANAKDIHDTWRKNAKAETPETWVVEGHISDSRVYPAVRKLVEVMPRRAVRGKRTAYSPADKDLAAAGMALALTGPDTIQTHIFTRDEDILVLVRDTMTALTGYADMTFPGQRRPLTVWKFDRRGLKDAPPTYEYQPFWGVDAINPDGARRLADRLPGKVKDAMGRVVYYAAAQA